MLNKSTFLHKKPHTARNYPFGENSRSLTAIIHNYLLDLNNNDT